MGAPGVLWAVGGIAALLYLWVGYFGVFTLGPTLGCTWAPEFRFWGYGVAHFTDCFEGVPQPMIAEYRAVLGGSDRLLAAALTAFLMLFSRRLNVVVGMVAAMAYGLSDWFENAFLVAALDGDLTAIQTASLLTMSKFACLTCAIGACLWAARRNRSMT